MITPKNKEQEQAIKMGIDFIEKGDAAEWFTIVGKAGTGKTTIVQAILEKYINAKTILICALSHKAKLVLAEKLKTVFGETSIISKSIAGALGMNMDNETGSFVLDRKQEPVIKKAHIIIIDECSMINEECHELIMQEKRKKAKVIYLGDIRQLPPIREAGDPQAEKPSPSFYTNKRAVLTERIRQGEDSPILPFADYFGDNSRLAHPAINPVPQYSRSNVANGKGSLVFTDNMFEVIETALPLYLKAIDKGDTNLIKTVTYRNDTRKNINRTIRELVFGRDKSKLQFVVGDLLMFHDNYQVADVEEPISNSYEVQINKVEQAQDCGYKVWKVDFIYEAKPISVMALDQTEIKRHEQDVSRKFAYAKSLPFGSQERIDALADAWSLKKKYAPLEYAYAITSHKAQGSTYNTVIVDERDILSVRMISNKSKSQSMYTAITRASKSCIVLDGQQTDESLLRAAVEHSLNELVAENAN